MTSSSSLARAMWWRIPGAVLLMLVAIMASDRPVDTPLAVVDLDQSASSRALIRQLDASQRLAVVQWPAQDASLQHQLATGKISGVLTIAPDYQAALQLGEQTELALQLNMASYLQASQIHSQLLQQTITDTVRQQAKQFLAGGQAKQQASDFANPVAIDWVRHGNPDLSYRRILLPGFLLQAWNLCFSLLSVWLLAPPLHQPSSSPSTSLARVARAQLCYGLWLAGIALGLWWLLGTPVSWRFLLAGALNLLAMTGIAMTLLGITKSLRLSLNGMSVIAATALAFMGVSFPFASMPPVAQWWASLLPITWLHHIWQGPQLAPFILLFGQALGWLTGGYLLWHHAIRRQHG